MKKIAFNFLGGGGGQGGRSYPSPNLSDPPLLVCTTILKVLLACMFFPRVEEFAQPPLTKPLLKI